MALAGNRILAMEKDITVRLANMPVVRSGDGVETQPNIVSCTGSPPPGTTPPGPSPTPPPPSGGRARPGSVPYGSLITSCTVPGVVALTFDDGPYIYTGELLDLLKNNGVHASFFINGQNWGAPVTDPSNQALLRRMRDEGHQIASHTWSHPSLNSLSTADIISQMTQLESAIISAIGVAPTYMRPPYFDCNDACLGVMNDLSYHIIIASLDTLDWAHQDDIQTSRDIFSNAVNPSNPASDSFLVLEHDVHVNTVRQLVQFMIDTLKAKGYRTATVGECLGDPAENWYRTL